MSTTTRATRARPSSDAAPRRRFSLPALSTESLTALASAVFLAVFNASFWSGVVGQDQASWRLLALLVVLAFALQAFLLGLLVWRWSAKPLLSVLLLTSAAAAYYMGAYRIYLDADMLANILHTDMRESRELLVPALLPWLLLAGAGSWLVWKLPLVRHSWLKALGRRLLFLLGMLVLMVGTAAVGGRDLSAFMRNHHEARFLLTPYNYLTGLPKMLAGKSASDNRVRAPIGTDARQVPAAAGNKPRLLVFVLGETVRAQNWGLNGYARQTTPQLAAMPDVINFPDAHSCGTATEVSVPCLFSPYGRRHYDQDTIRGHQSLLHVLDHAGVQTLWRDNQTGCKGVCDGLPFESTRTARDPQWCTGADCFDEILLKGLADKLTPDGKDRIVVLHVLGNHGPAYYLRYPPQFRRFTPTCDSDDLGKCDNQQIVNSYDNAVLYADHFIASTIELLKQQEAHYDTALVYASDHGESLGEKGLFLHGVPYAIAPDEQTHVPMVMWFSPQFAASQKLDLACVRREAAGTTGHDNLFPSFLGLFQVRTSVYDPSLDLFARCRAPTTTAAAP